MTVISNQVYSAMADQIGVRSINGRVAGDLHDYLNDLQAGTVPFNDVITKGPWVDVRVFGAVGDGVTDDTAAIQAAMDYVAENHCTLYVPANMTIVSDCLKLSNATNFKIRVDGLIKLCDNASYTDISKRSLLVLVGCSNFSIDRWDVDANVANNGVTIKEHTHCLELYQCSDFHLGFVRGINLCGDVIYISDCTNVTSDTIVGYSNYTGRDTLSIIHGENMSFSTVVSINVGTEDMPGGVDLETDNSSQYIRNIQFGNVYVEGKGTSIFGLNNNWGSDCRDVTVNNLILRLHSKTGAGWYRIGLSINNFDNVSVGYFSVTEIQAIAASLTGIGCYVNGGNNISINGNLHNLYKGAQVGYSVVVNKMNMNCFVSDVATYGLDMGLVSYSTFNVNIENCNMIDDADVNNIIFGFGGTISHTTINGTLVKGAHGNTQAVFLMGTHDTVSFNCDFVGWTPQYYFRIGAGSQTNFYCRNKLFMTSATLLNSFTGTISYAKEKNGTVHLYVTLANIPDVTPHTIIATLPTGYIPLDLLPISVNIGNIYPYGNGSPLSVLPSGSIILEHNNGLSITTDAGIVGYVSYFSGN